MSTKRIYLDVCVLCRIFDDQTQARIKLETDALSLILTYLRETELEAVFSSVHNAEINAIRRAEEKAYLLLLLIELNSDYSVDNTIARQRAENLAANGMGVADAAHVAIAELSNADFVSVDDRLLKQCLQLGVAVWSGSPLAYCVKENLR